MSREQHRKPRLGPDEILKQTEATFALEGLELDEEDKERIRRLASGEITEKQAVQEVMAEIEERKKHG